MFYTFYIFTTVDT